MCVCVCVCVCNMEFYSAVKKKKECKNAPGATWIDLLGIVLSEIKSKTKTACYHLYVESKK